MNAPIMLLPHLPLMPLLRTLVVNELRLRLRRLSTIAAMLGLIALGWHMLVDTHSGHATMVINSARVMYTSSMLSLATAIQASPLFALLGFYLIRGRIAEDLRSGIGSVIAATPVGNGWFLFSRWLGGVVYLLALVVCLLLTMLVSQALRGDGPVQPGVYLQTYLVVLLPIILFAVSFAVLFDSIAALMGKGGDVLYFFIWISQLSLLSPLQHMQGTEIPPVFILDFTGMLMAVANFKSFLHTDNLSIGYNAFNPDLAPIILPATIWSAKMMWMRAASAVLAVLPLLPAMALFHRFSPDRVKAGNARSRRTPLAVLNDWLRPLTKVVQPLFALAASLPGMGGKIIADMALTLVASPSAIAVLILSAGASIITGSHSLAGLLVPVLGFWGVLISDISTRDFQAGLEEMTAAVPGGIDQRFLRQWLASMALGLLFAGIVLLRWSFTQPLYALALLCGIACMSAFATLLGRASRTSRTFVSIFLVWIYIALNVDKEPLLDMLAFNLQTNSHALGWHLMMGLAALLAGLAVNRWRSA